MRVPKTASRVHPGPIWNPSRCHYVYLTSIRVLPHLHPCPKYLVPPPSMCDLTSNQVPKFFFNHHPYRGSPPFRPHLNSMQVAIWSPPPPPPPIYNIHPFHVSHPSMPRELLLSSILVPPLRIQVSRSVSQPNPGPISLSSLNICIPSPPRTRLTQFRSHFTSINIIVIVYQLHPIEMSLPSRSCLTWIQVQRYLCNIHPCSSSTPSRCTDLHLSSTQPPSHLQWKSWELHLNSIQITYQLCLAYEIYISPPSMCTLTAIEVHWLASHLHPGHVSLASWSSLTLILVTIIASQFHQSPIIPPSRYRGICVSLPSTLLSTPSRPLDSWLTFIQIESHPNPGPHNCTSPQSRWHLTSSQAPAIAFQIHRDTISDPPRFQNVHRFPSYTYPGNVSNPSTSPKLTSHIPPVRVSPKSSSRYLHLTSTQMMSHLHPCPRILVSPPSRYCITSIQVQKFFSHNDPYHGSHLSRFHLTQIQVEMWVSSPSTPHVISI